MPHELIIAPSGRLALVERSSAGEAASDLSRSLVDAFSESPSRGLLHLATNELQSRLPPPLDYVRSFARTYLTRLCQTQGHEATKDLPPTAAAVRRGPDGVDHASPADDRPGVPARGSPRRLGGPTWTRWSARRFASTPAARRRISATKILSGGLSAASRCIWPRTNAMRRTRSRSWRRMSADCRPRATSSTNPSVGRCSNMPGTGTGKRLLSLLVPLQKAAERSPLIKELVDSGDVYHAAGVVAAQGAPLLAGRSDLRGKRPDRPRSRLVEAPSSPAGDRQREDRRPAQVGPGGRCVARFLGRRRAGRRAVDRGRASGIAGLGGRTGSAQGQVGGDRPRETGRGARTLANHRTPGPRQRAVLL